MRIGCKVYPVSTIPPEIHKLASCLVKIKITQIKHKPLMNIPLFSTNLVLRYPPLSRYFDFNASMRLFFLPVNDFTAKTEFLVISGEKSPTLRTKIRNFRDYDFLNSNAIRRLSSTKNKVA